MRNHFAVDANSFAKGHEVRGDKKPGAVYSCATDQVDHGANGAFAVRASDMNGTRFSRGFRRGSGKSEPDWHCTRGACAPQIEMQLRDQALDIFQAKLDTEAVKAVEPGERFLIGKRSRACRFRCAMACQGGLFHVHCADEK